MEMLAGTSFALRPDYENLVEELGTPPTGMPDECTFAYGWDMAHKKVEHENRAAEQAQRQVQKSSEAPAKKAPAKRPAKRTPTKRRPSVAARLDAEFGK